MNGVQTRFKCKLDVKRCKRFVFPPSSLLPRSNALKTKAIRYFQTDRTLTRIVSPPLIKDRKLEHSITIHPFTQNITQEYLNSSILALSSNYEGFGLVLIEAMSLGVPCVSFDCPFGPSEIIRNQEDGLLVKNGDIQGFANALCHLIEHEAERKAFGKRAKQNITRYSLRNIMPQWEILFHKLTEK